jgi:outer membrane lipoprotein-sorting protein
MKRLFTLWMLALLPYCISAQTDAKAAEVLDKVLEDLSDSNGIRADFEGSETGFLLLKGEKFYLNNGNVQSWYDGKTQWSYVADTEEVNISHPTLEELQGINPYLILMRYKTDFNYTYKGSQTRNGVKGHEIVLTPKHSEQSEVIRVFISKTYHPLAMKMEQNGQTLSEINVTSYKTDQKLEDGMFRFNKSLFPNAEIIDMR